MFTNYQSITEVICKLEDYNTLTRVGVLQAKVQSTTELLSLGCRLEKLPQVFT